MRILLILNIIRRPIKPPFRQRPTALNLLLQSLAISPKLGIRPIFAPHLKPVVRESVGDVAIIFVDLLR